MMLKQFGRRIVASTVGAALASVMALGAMATELDLETITIPLDGGDTLTAEEGFLSVPEQRAKADSRSIQIGFRRIAKVEGAGGAPVFLLAGGPGGSFNERLGEGGYRQDRTMRLINMYRQVGDVVLVDLRGVNLSTPNTLCDGPRNKWRRAMNEEAMYAIFKASGADCRAKLIEEGFDISGYTVLAAAQDVIDVADALGYGQINVTGTSFGSHWGVTLAKYHGERIDNLLLTGLEGLDHTIDDPEQVGKAVRLISATAKEAWGGAHGVEGPAEAMEALAQRAAEDPKSAFGLRPYEIYEAATNSDGYGLSGRGGWPGWPAKVDDFMNGKVRYFKMVRWWMSRFVGKGWDAAAVGMLDCASWITPEREAKLAALPQQLAPDNLKYYSALCEGWDVPQLSDDFRADFTSPIRTLFIHGDMDISTPLSNAEETIKLFPNGQLTVVSNGSHGVLIEILSNDEAMEGVIVDWFKGGDFLPAQIALPPVTFEPLD